MKTGFLKICVVISLLLLANVSYGAIHFDNTDDFVDTNFNKNWGTNDSFSISMWVNVDNTPTVGSEIFTGTIISGGGAIILFGLEVGSCSTDLHPIIILRDSSAVVDSLCFTSALTAGTWHHVMFTFNNVNQDVYAYLDGTQVGSNTAFGATGAFNVSAADFYIGGNNHTVNGLENPFDGAIEEYSIWTDELSATDAAQLGSSMVRRMPLQVSPSTLEVYFPMDDGADGTSADGDSLVEMGGGTAATGNDGANNTGLDWESSGVLSYP